MFWGYLHVILGWGASIHLICLGLGASAHLSGILVLVSKSIVLSLWVASYWTGYLDVCYASCYWTFLCSFHYISSPYYHGYDCYSSGNCGLFWYIISSSVTMDPSLLGHPAVLGQCDVVLLPPLTLWCPGGVIGLASVPQQQLLSLMPLQAYANYAMGSPQVGFFFRVEPPTI